MAIENGYNIYIPKWPKSNNNNLRKYLQIVLIPEPKCSLVLFAEDAVGLKKIKKKMLKNTQQAKTLNR